MDPGDRDPQTLGDFGEVDDLHIGGQDIVAMRNSTHALHVSHR